MSKNNSKRKKLGCVLLGQSRKVGTHLTNFTFVKKQDKINQLCIIRMKEQPLLDNIALISCCYSIWFAVRNVFKKIS